MGEAQTGGWQHHLNLPPLHTDACELLQWSKRTKLGGQNTTRWMSCHLRRKGPPEPPIHTFFPDDLATPVNSSAPSGPVLDGVELRSLAPPG